MSPRGRKSSPHPFDLHVGARLRRQRLRRKLSQDALEKAIGVNRGIVGKLERGNSSVSPDRLVSLATVLGVDIGFFFAEMPEAASGNVAPAVSAANHDEVEQFIRSYLAISDRDLRKDLYNLVKAVAGRDPNRGTRRPRATARKRKAKPAGKRRGKSKSPGLASIIEAITATGMIYRGGFHPLPGDGVPHGGATVILVGDAGPSMWRVFTGGRGQGDMSLDDWTRDVLSPVAEALGARVLFPFDGPPYLPFQRWARRAEPVHHSPLGTLIHPEYGLWHAYRGALVFDRRLHPPPPGDLPSPCRDCPDRPCLTACPVDAHTTGGFDLASCVTHMSSPRGRECTERGCRQRLACPVGRDYAHEPARIRFHMERFLDKYRSAAVPGVIPPVMVIGRFQ